MIILCLLLKHFILELFHIVWSQVLKKVKTTLGSLHQC